MFSTVATELLFGGASEGGKSYGLRIAYIVWATLVPGLQLFLYRKYYNDVIQNHMLGADGFKQLLQPWTEGGIVKCTENQVTWLETGSTINLAQLRTEEDFDKAQGITKHVMAIDEATQIRQRYIAGLRGWVRMPLHMRDKLPEQLRPIYPDYSDEQLRNFFPRIIYPCNPIGTSVAYFRRHFVEPREPYVIEEASESEGGFLRQYIPSRVTDNFSADPVAQRKRLSGMGEQVAKALIEGSWEQPTGDYYREWDEAKHVVPDFTPPGHWFKYQSFDWGSAEPFACYWWCVADGQEFISNGRVFWFPAGAIIAYREWYGCDPEAPAKGIRLSNRLMARGIIDRTHETTSGLIVTDILPFADRGHSDAESGKKYTIADEFLEEGVRLTLGNTRRIQGWQRLRSLLVGVDDVPMLYVVESCKYLRDYFPLLSYHPSNAEDAEEKGEATHALDATRLAAMVRGPIREEKSARTTDSPPGTVQVNAARILKQIRKEERGRRYG